MSDKEIAMQLTLKAMETGMIIRPSAGNGLSDEQIQAKDETNSQIICDFYRTILKTISSEEIG